MFGLTSYLVKKQQTPEPQKKQVPTKQAVQAKHTAKLSQANKPVHRPVAARKVSKPVQGDLPQVYHLKNKLKATKAAYEKLLNQHDSLKRVAEILQKPTQKAESGRDK
ncbi:hypothetical protein M23134_02573 [Microscilla marina ATCC 23134]|uniref:Uncharacterized protein n=1 Tax=Microscilla marina ATCC 23134 TaxID=313606 RepID=A1ZNM7_MICM2|nr:hypothetical protein M23134_02573 [Microscilla marina ATCC 23134]